MLNRPLSAAQAKMVPESLKVLHAVQVEAHNMALAAGNPEYAAKIKESIKSIEAKIDQHVNEAF